MPRGQPSKYKKHYAQELIDYFSVKPYSQTQDGFQANDFPTLAGFAIKIGVARDTLHQWQKVHPDFSDAYKRAKDFQENFLAVNGNRGLVPAAFAIFTAKNVLGWRDKQPGEEDKVTVNNFNQLSDEDLDQKIKDLSK